MLIRQTVHRAKLGLVEQQIAVANLALLEDTSLAVSLEGTFASTLQLLFGAVAILAASFAYLYFPNQPFIGRLIAVVSLQPGPL